MRTKEGKKRRTMLTTNNKERRQIWLRPDWALGGRKFRKWIFLTQITKLMYPFLRTFHFYFKMRKIEMCERIPTKV